MDDLLRLSSLCTRPDEPIRPVPEKSERKGLEVPIGHLELIHTYGVGCFDEFLWIFGKNQANPNLDIDARTGVAQPILAGKEIPQLRDCVAEFGLTPEDLVSWGVTDNADSLMWIPSGAPEEWPTLVIEAGQLDFTLLARNSTGVILDLLTRVSRISFFPEEFPDARPEFSVNPYAA